MTALSYDEIIAIFSYTEDDQEAFPYLRVYMQAITPKLPQILENDKRRRRFMLAGLFLTYRAINFQGDSMTTEFNVENRSGPGANLLAYKRITGEPIKNTLDYVRKIRLFIRMPIVYIFGPGKMLYWFVMYG